MGAKINKQNHGVSLIEEFSPTQRINLIDMIDDLIRMTGLLTFSTVQKVHWLANFATFCFIAVYVLQIIALFKANGDPERLFECFSVLSFCGMGVLKLISLRLYHRHWRYLLTQISTLENEQLNSSNSANTMSATENSFTDSIKNYTNNFKGTSTILTRMYSFTAVIFILSPFVEHFLMKLRGVEPVGYPHILPIWSPLDTISVYGYTITIACECLAAVYCVCVHIAFDLTAVGIMTFIYSQFSLLRDCSELIGGRGNMLDLSRIRDDRAHFRIVQCHRTHILLINSIQELGKLLKNILGVYFFVATLTLCSVAIRINSEGMSLMQLLSLLQYMFATLTQLFLFCRYGDTVLNESSISMGQGPFVAAYWCLSPPIRRELMILGAGMMRPQRLRAGPFHSLDLASFIQVVRAAYSYYAVLGNKE